MLTIAGGIIIAVVALAFLPELLLSAGVLVLAAVALLSAVLLYSGITENWSSLWPVLLWLVGVAAITQLSLVYVRPENEEENDNKVWKGRFFAILTGSFFILAVVNLSVYNGVGLAILFGGWYWKKRNQMPDASLPNKSRAETFATLLGEFFAWLLMLVAVLAVILLTLGGIAALLTGHAEAAIPLLFFGLPGFVLLVVGEKSKNNTTA